MADVKPKKTRTEAPPDGIDQIGNWRGDSSLRSKLFEEVKPKTKSRSDEPDNENA